MIKSITNFLIILFIFRQLKSKIYQIDQNGYNPFCDETLHWYVTIGKLFYNNSHTKCKSNKDRFLIG